MIHLLEWAVSLIAYLGVGMGMARAQAKRVFRQAAKMNKGDRYKATQDFQASLAGWVFLWPLRTFSAILKFCLLYLLIRPAEVSASWCADIVKAPVATTLQALEEAQEQGEEWGKKAKDPEADEISREVAEEMRDAALKRHKEICEDLGLEVPLRRAISPSSQETIDRGVQSAQAILREMRTPQGVRYDF